MALLCPHLALFRQALYQDRPLARQRGSWTGFFFFFFADTGGKATTSWEVVVDTKKKIQIRFGTGDLIV